LARPRLVMGTQGGSAAREAGGGTQSATGPTSGTMAAAIPAPWSVLLWTVPAHVRMNGRQVCEALDRSQKWLHHHSSPRYSAANGLPPLPVRRGRGGLWTTVGELRDWVERHWGMAA